MKRIGRVLFVILYIWATAKVAGERSVRVADRVQHASASAVYQIDCTYSAGDLPNFGHAEKAKPNVAEISLELSRAPQIVVWEFEELPDDENGSSFEGEVNNSRAPPFLI
jgi:hypothetical protein